MAAPRVRVSKGLLKRIKVPSGASAPSRRWASTSLAQEIHATSEGIDIKEVAEKRGIKLPLRKQPLSPEDQSALSAIRTPHNLTAIRLRPLRRTAEHGVPVCDLQLRTYSVANMDLFADFALRAAYYLNLPAKGPIPLPRITERWTVPRGNFVHKKSQENFERITMRRLIQIQDGHPETVRIWLGVLQKYQYHGVGMKANVWEWETLGAAAEREAAVAKAQLDMDKVWKGFGTRKESVMGQKIQEILARPEYGGVLEVARKESDRQRARMDAADEKRRAEDKAIEDEEFDRSFVKAYGPDALRKAHEFNVSTGALSDADAKAEVERMNKVMAELDSMSETEILALRRKWAAQIEEAEEEDGVALQNIEEFLSDIDTAEKAVEEPPSDTSPKDS